MIRWAVPGGRVAHLSDPPPAALPLALCGVRSTVYHLNPPRTPTCPVCSAALAQRSTLLP